MISKGKCIPIQKYRYKNRCDRPPLIDFSGYSGTSSPTFGGTVMPTQNTFGEPYVEFQMYANQDNEKNKIKHKPIDIIGNNIIDDNFENMNHLP